MTLTNEQQVAICRVLSDVVEEVSAVGTMDRSRHYRTLKDTARLTDEHFEAARGVSVLSSLAVVKEIHYKLKMMLGMTVCELYSEEPATPLHHRMAFEILMAAIDWPLSFSETKSFS